MNRKRGRACSILPVARWPFRSARAPISARKRPGAACRTICAPLPSTGPAGPARRWMQLGRRWRWSRRTSGCAGMWRCSSARRMRAAAPEKAGLCRPPCHCRPLGRPGRAAPFSVVARAGDGQRDDALQCVNFLLRLSFAVAWPPAGRYNRGISTGSGKSRAQAGRRAACAAPEQRERFNGTARDNAKTISTFHSDTKRGKAHGRVGRKP